MEIVSSKPRFVIEKCSLVTQWAWDTINDCCPICRNSVNEDSITNENNPHINSVVVVGLCGHAFHYDCINRWLKNSKNCPLCNSEWQFQKTMDKDTPDTHIETQETSVQTEVNHNLTSLPAINVSSNNNENISNLSLSPISTSNTSLIGSMTQLNNQMIDLEESIIDDDNDEFSGIGDHI